jgi:hypothetical protein
MPSTAIDVNIHVAFGPHKAFRANLRGRFFAKRFKAQLVPAGIHAAGF